MKIARLILAAWVLATGVAHAQSQEAPSLFEKYGCSSCHTNDEAVTGPAYVEIAAKYRGNLKATPILVAVVRKGTHGGGPWPMPPSPQVPTADAEKMAQYILALKK